MKECLFFTNTFLNLDTKKKFTTYDDGLSNLYLAIENIYTHFWDFNFFSTYTDTTWTSLNLAREWVTELFKMRNIKNNEALRKFEFFKVIRSYPPFKQHIKNYTDVFTFFYSNTKKFKTSKIRNIQVIKKYTWNIHFDAILTYLDHPKRRCNVIATIMKRKKFDVSAPLKFFWAFEQHKNWNWHYHCFTTHPFFLIWKSVMDIKFIWDDIHLEHKNQIFAYISKYVVKNVTENIKNFSVKKILKTNIEWIYEHKMSVLPQEEKQSDKVKHLYNDEYLYQVPEKENVLEDFLFLKDEWVLNVITWEAWTWKTHKMIEIYKEKVSQGFKCYFWAITQKRQMTLNQMLWQNFKNFYREFRFNRTFSRIIWDYEFSDYDYIFLDDISPMLQKHFVDFLSHIGLVKWIYATWHWWQLMNLDLSNFVTQTLTHQWRRKTDFILKESDYIKQINEQNYLEILDLFQSHSYLTRLTNNNNLNRILKFAIDKNNYLYSWVAMFTTNFWSIFNWQEIQIQNNEFQLQWQSFNIKDFLPYIRFIYNTYSVQWETYDHTAVFIDYTYQYTSSDANLYVLNTRATTSQTTYKFILKKSFLKKIKRY